MYDGQVEKTFEWAEISIPVQQRMVLAYTECCDNAVDCFPNSVAATAQRAIVPSCFPRQLDAGCFKYFQLEQLPLDVFRDRLIANALKNFAENQIREPETLPIEFHVEPLGLGIRDSLEVIDPNSRVDDHHAAYLATRPRRDASRSPSQATLPRKRRMVF